MDNKTPETQKSDIWELGIVEVTGHNLESSGREEVNKLPKEGWVLLHIYTLKYIDEKDNGTWRQRPMAILGKPESIPPESKN